ncbi:MAG: glycosyltransferase family 39 protein, partial [Candidatus Hodarchaeota archaeon]
LAQGKGYRILSLPDQPYQTKYPPLYPLLLSAVWRTAPDFPDNLRIAILVSWLTLPVYLLTALLLFREFNLGWLHSIVLCCALALNPYVTLCSVSLMTELTFCSLLLASLVLIERATRSRTGGLLTIAAGVLAAAAFLTKSVAIVLCVSGTLYFVLQRQYRRAALFLGSVLPAILAWS